MVTKKEIVKSISDDLGLTQLKTKEIVQMTFDAIIDTLVDDPRHRIELRNFGVFEVKKRAARKARNPRTGERVDVEEKFVVTFKPGKEMEERVLQLEQREREKRLAAEAAANSSESTPAQAVSTQPPAFGSQEASVPPTTPSETPPSVNPSSVNSPAYPQ